VFNTLSDPYLRVAFDAGLAATLLTLAIAVSIVGLRVSLRRREARWQAFLAAWRPALLAAMMGEGGALPTLPRRDRSLFLRLWAYLHESVRGEAGQRLNVVARALGLQAAALHQLRSGARADRLLAILALGHLRDKAAWPALSRLAARPDPLVSVLAARALVQIDPFDAAVQLMPLMLRRQDWDVARVANFLAEAREAFWLLLVRSLPGMDPADVPRALRLAEALRITLPPAALRALLGPGQPAPVVHAALRLAEHGEVAGEVRRALGHEDGGVRAQAARQLVRLGEPGDELRLARLLEDSEWPVRLAAAQALAGLPFLSTAQLQALRAATARGADVLDHVLAERDLA